MARTKAIAAVQAEPLPPGDSAEQRWAERLIVDAVAERIGVHAEPHIFILKSGNRITVDGLSRRPPVLIEAWAHVGSPKPLRNPK